MRAFECIGAGIFIVYLAILFAGLGISAYGLYLAFCASIILGIIVLFAEPAPFIIGVVALLTGKDLAKIVIDWITH